ncbi:hypothetical protein GPECTOR_19g364 [Gonium pectorale]|uniref:Uncharacterized protein n=1 Tax=Gonium pectorale TaxID=33097 RepID=A0A150GJC8_GONPE|nr:hypothetical protein GPECTOR_19g364 [Gonium pectorale]|eukprot:KXZ49913.1 hypothetical protein GPECTOR_19g364 [Gonium pectorale]
MVSNTRRFSDRVCYTGPGPAEYMKTGAAALEDKSFSRAPVSAAFHDRTASSVMPLDRMATHVGPGAYDGAAAVTRTGARVDYLSRPGASSAFRGGGHELITCGNMEAPPSTSYDLGDPWARTHSVGRGGSRMGTSSFGTGARGAASVGSMAATLDSLLFGAPASAAAKPDTGPGPGSYELQDFASIRAKLSREANRPSPQFQVPENGEAAQRQGPRPVLVSTSAKVAHDYLSPSHAPLSTTNPPRGVSSPFRSRSAGHEEAIDQRSYSTSSNAPGPAYYQPSTAIKKSFHKNSKKHYVTIAH